MPYRTEQEAFWAGEFGSDYIDRNASQDLLASNVNFFSRILRAVPEAPAELIELGANIGMNLRALRTLLPESGLDSVEINPEAAKELTDLDFGRVFQTSILDFQPSKTYSLVFTKGVLIHIAPNELPSVYDLMAALSDKYVLIAEYYNPSPVSISYRGHEERLFKRDFAGEFMDRNPEFSLVDYGFSYHRDPVFPQDDISWFLMSR